MKKFFLYFTIITGTFLSCAVQAAPGSVILTFTAKNIESEFTQRKNGDLGEYTQERTFQEFEYKRVGSGSLASMNRSYTSEWRRVIGKEIPGRSEAKLVMDGKDLFWEIDVEIVNSDGQSQTSNVDVAVEFTKGDWAAF